MFHLIINLNLININKYISKKIKSCLFVGYCAICIQHNFTFLQEKLPDADCTTAVMDNLFDKTNHYDIDHCEGKIRKKSKLLKILLMKGNPACMDFFKVIEANLDTGNLIPIMKKRSADKTTRGKYGS